MSKINFEDYDDVEVGGYHKDHHDKEYIKKDFKGKGHQAKHTGHNYSAFDMTDANDTPTIRTARPYVPPIRPQEKPTSPMGDKVEREYGPNTHEIRSVKIDFDGVEDIIKFERVRETDQVLTYGIKFIFNKKYNSGRPVYFGTNQKARDIVYEKEYAYWQSLKK